MSEKTNLNRIKELSDKWLSGKLTEAEKMEFDLWYNSFCDQEVSDLSEKELIDIGDRIYKTVKENIGYPLNKKKNDKIILMVRIGLVAACISFFIIIFSYLNKNDGQKLTINDKQFFSTISPGKAKAILKLEDGKIYNLDTLQKGEIVQNSGVKIEKDYNGNLVYSLLKNSPSKVIYNTITTPNGGQFKITLVDGSQVWLNAGSELTFPIRFSNTKREIHLKGEAYFEVAPNDNSPFIVKTNLEQVEVLGTHFNVKAYLNEISNVSLIEGSVKVSLPSKIERILKPGEQTIINKGNIDVQGFDIEEAIAWKNGEFMFNNENMKSVMSKLSRWYDVEIVVSPDIEEISIWGSVSRYKNIEEVLKIIEIAGSVHFKIEGRRIHVIK